MVMGDSFLGGRHPLPLRGAQALLRYFGGANKEEKVLGSSEPALTLFHTKVLCLLIHTTNWNWYALAFHPKCTCR